MLDQTTRVLLATHTSRTTLLVEGQFFANFLFHRFTQER